MIETKITRTVVHEGVNMKPTIWFLKGLPASGKSTWAKENSTSTVVRLNNDVFRTMMTGEYSDKKEGVVTAGIRAAGMDALHRGMDIIIDNTNLSMKHHNFWSQIAKQHEYAMVELFFDTPLDVCIERDAHRPDGQRVGAERITEMYENAFGSHEQTTVVEYRKQNTDLIISIIVDIDGTLAFMNGRNPFNDEGIERDIPNEPIVEIVKSFSKTHKIIVMSGRQRTLKCLEATEAWLNKHLGCDYTLLMRPAGDVRKDSIVKRELFDIFIDGKFYVDFVLDDRDQVVEMWRKELNLPCLQVNYGNF